MKKATEMSNAELVEFTQACIESPARETPKTIIETLATRLQIATQSIDEMLKERRNHNDAFNAINAGLINLKEIVKAQAE